MPTQKSNYADALALVIQLTNSQKDKLLRFLTAEREREIKAAARADAEKCLQASIARKSMPPLSGTITGISGQAAVKITPKKERDPTLVALFRGSKLSYDENITLLIADLDKSIAAATAGVERREKVAVRKKNEAADAIQIKQAD